jgi:hypothetical protein
VFTSPKIIEIVLFYLADLTANLTKKSFLRQNSRGRPPCRPLSEKIEIPNSAGMVARPANDIDKDEIEVTIFSELQNPER